MINKKMKFIKTLKIIICFLAVFTLSNQTIIAQSGCMTISYEADYHYYQLHGSNTSHHINQVINEVERIYKNSGIDLNFTVVSSNIIKSSIQDTYGISSIFNSIQNVWNIFRNKGYANGSADVALLFSGKKLSHHGVAAGGGACSANSYAVGICVNKNQGYKLTPRQEAQIHAHEIGHLLSDTSHDTDSSIMNESIPYVSGATRFNTHRSNLIKNTINSKSCLSCGGGIINPPVVSNNCTLNVSNSTACEFYFEVNNVTYSLPANVNYTFNVRNGTGYKLLYTNWNIIENRVVNCSNSNYNISTNFCAGTSNPIVSACSSPSNVSASNVTSNGCNLNWNNSGASNYVLYQLINSSWFKLTDVYGTSVGLGLAPGSIYTFGVESVCGSNRSGNYAQTTVQTPNLRNMDSQSVNAGGSNEVSIIENNLTSLNIENMSIYPNPLKNNGSVEFTLNTDSEVSLYISDLLGKKVVELINSEVKTVGKHKVSINGKQLAKGIYYCTLEADNYLQTEKLLISN